MDQLIPSGQGNADENLDSKSAQRDQADGQPRHDKSRRKKPRQVFGEGQCLEALTQLVGLTAMGMLKPAQANSMRGTLTAIFNITSTATPRVPRCT